MEVYSKLHGFLSKKQQEQAVINPPINSELRRLYRGPQANQAVRSKQADCRGGSAPMHKSKGNASAYL